MSEHHTKNKGDIGVAKIITDLVEKDYNIFLPISEHLPYDLIAEKDGKLYRIQCKYRSKKEQNKNLCILIPKHTVWSDKNGTHEREYKDSDFDYFGIYNPESKTICYPSVKLRGITIAFEVPDSPTKFYWYKDFLEFTDKAVKHSYKDFGMELTKIFGIDKSKINDPRPQYRKVERPSKDRLCKLVWEFPTIKLAEKFGVSDKAIEKWTKAYGIEKPPRGYWAKKQHNKL